MPRITNLPTTATVADDAIVPLVSGGVTKRCSASAMRGFPSGTAAGTCAVWSNGASTAKKPPPVGHFDPQDYAQGDSIGTDGVDCTAAFERMLAEINDDTALDYRGATVILDAKKTYYFASAWFPNRSIHLDAQGGGGFATDGTTLIKFAAGQGIAAMARGLDVSRASGFQLSNVEIVCQPVAGVLDYAHDTAYSVGQVVQYLHDRSLLFEVVKVTGTGKTATALASSGADYEWSAGRSVTAGDECVPSTLKQNGRKYVALTSGTTHATTEPNLALYGGWNWKSAALIVDNNVVWQESGPYLPDHSHNVIRPFTDAQSAKVRWIASTTYDHNDVVRLVGHAREFTHWLWQAQGTRGTTASDSTALATALTSASYNDTIVDNGITWTVIDPVAQGLLFVDNEVTFFPRLHPCIAIRVPGTTIGPNVTVGGASNGGLDIQGSEGVPTSNVNFWQAIFVSFKSLGGDCINVRGGDGNGGVAIACKTTGPWTLEQASGGVAGAAFRDYSAAGGSYHGCAVHEAFTKYGFDFGGLTQRNNIHGGYIEGGPSRFNSGTEISGLCGSASSPGSWTRDSNPIAPGFGRGIFGEEDARPVLPAITSTHTLHMHLAGWKGPASTATGYQAFGFRASTNTSTGEANYTGPSWKNTGWDTGWWGWTFGPETYGGIFTAFSWTGDLAGAWCDLSSAGQITINRKSLGFGHPNTGSGPSFGLHFRSAIPVSGTWSRGQIVFYETPSAGGKLGAVCVTAGTPGTWKEWGAIDA